jgi:hypothetical protein
MDFYAKSVYPNFMFFILTKNEFLCINHSQLKKFLTNMKIIFCNHFLSQNEIDPDFSAEYTAAKKAGFSTLLINFEALQAGNIFAALRKIPFFETQEKAIYRGWMLTDAQYEAFYQGLLAKNIALIHDTKMYLHTHYFPNTYPIIKEYTPKSVYFELENEHASFEEQLNILAIFGDKPLIIKDFVKSEKHDWHTACFIPSANDKENVQKITRNFLSLRDKFLNKGLVYREFVKLAPLKQHSKSDMPLTQEYRLFYWENALLCYAEYWEEGTYNVELPDLSVFHALAKQIESRFFTMDIAKLETGEWIIMELGDGQVSGLPERLEVNIFYQNLAKLC